MSAVRSIFGFPATVNDKAARAVAGQVVATAVAALVLSLTVGHAWLWLTAALAVGFLARVLAGPTLSPFGQLATRVLAPRLGAAKIVPGAPKRFAQSLGFGMTGAATVLLATGHPLGTQVLLGMLVVAAGLEAALGFCLGCRIFALGMRLGIIPESACAECADLPSYFRAKAAIRADLEAGAAVASPLPVESAVAVR